MEIYSHYNGKFGLICFAIYLLMLFRGRKTFSGTIQQSKNYWFVFICMALYSVLGFLEWDTYHYYEHYQEMYQYNKRIHVEPFFFWLVQVLPHSYLLYRFVIWGTASFIMVKAAKTLELDATVFCFLVPLLFITQLTVTRGALGLSLMVLSSILLIRSLKTKNTIWLIVGIIGLFFSSFLHKSMIIFLAILVLSYIIPLNKRTLIISLIAFPFLYGIVIPIFRNFSVFDSLNADQIYLVTKYQESEKTVMNINGVMQNVFEKAFYLLLVFNMAKKYLYDKIDSSKEHFFIFKYAYFLIYVSFLFLGQDVSNWISNRTLHAASFALVLCATQCYNTIKLKRKRSTMEKTILIGFIIISLWRQINFMIKNW